MSGKQGFASMTKEERSRIASMGGKSVPNDRRSFAQNRELAAAAGRKGGKAVPADRRSFAQDRDLAAAAGHKGGRRRPSIPSGKPQP